jgi:hypothetical protein
VTFDRNLSQCSAVATAGGNNTGGLLNGGTTFSVTALNDGRALVSIANSLAGVATADTNFYLVLVCRAGGLTLSSAPPVEVVSADGVEVAP